MAASPSRWQNAASAPARSARRWIFNSDLRPEILLFHEAPSRILVSTANPKAVLGLAAQHGVEAAVIGTTIENGLEIRQRGNTLGAWEIAASAPRTKTR